jgi:hypothetical protein
MGFEPVGVYRRIGWKFGAWHDVAWTQRALGVEQDPPPSRAEATGRLLRACGSGSPLTPSDATSAVGLDHSKVAVTARARAPGGRDA